MFYHKTTANSACLGCSMLDTHTWEIVRRLVRATHCHKHQSTGTRLGSVSTRYYLPGVGCTKGE